VNFKIREAKFEDSAGIGRVHVDSWRETYKGIIPDSVLDGLSYEQRTESMKNQINRLDPKNPAFCIWVAESSEKEIVGFAVGGPARQDKERNHKAMFLWVLEENQTAKFYQAMGGKAVANKVIEIGRPLDEVAYGWVL
jgi:hypothetical protein